MLTEKELKNLKIGDSLYVMDNLYEVMQSNWNDDMILTKNKIGTVVNICSDKSIILKFKELKLFERDCFYYNIECLSKQVPAYLLYKPKEKIQI